MTSTEDIKDVQNTTKSVEEEPRDDNEEEVESMDSIQKGDNDLDDFADDPIYKNKLPNRVIVTVNGRNPRNRRAPRLQFYVDRARRILRSDETVTVTGLGQAISMACTLVEVLKRQKIAEIESIRTNVDVDPTFVRSRLDWGRPTTSIRFILKRGPHATYVSDYHQRKVIEIFENRDPDKTGRLSKAKVKELKLGEAFFANDDRKNKGEEFLSKCDGDSINLPDFIRYASILINPLLKDGKFKEQLVHKFGIDEQDTQEQQEDDDDTENQN